ncbi:MAG: RluA family pseudouridine synthase [Planctomycetes bacterium]|nr:RluA family pseudouridine synthase [Planctomycetota bacterium]
MADPLQILFEDNHCIAVVKPAGLLTQGVPAGIPTLEAMVKAYLKEKYGKPGNVYLGVPHRLDRPVSGVVLFARNSKSAQRLAEQFRDRTVTKVYWGVVEGELQPTEGVWDDWLRKIADEARTETAPPNADGAKHAVMEYRVLQTCAIGTLVEFRPHTGRMHQIRIQAATHGHPLLGDSLYGSTRPFGPPADLARDRIIALHARSLTFLHPLHYEPMTLVAPLPAYWLELGVAEEQVRAC